MDLRTGSSCLRVRSACSICDESSTTMRVIARASAWLGVLLVAGCKPSGESPTAPESQLTLSSGAPAQSATATATPKAASAPASQIITSSPDLVVKCCGPFEFQPAAHLRYEVKLARGSGQDAAQLQLKSLTRADALPQAFELPYAWSPLDEYVLNGIDLNFDGVLDLAFGPVLGTPNETLDYWLTDPKGGSVEQLGRFANLKVDAAKRELETYEKGGHAGLLFEGKRYRWEEDKLTLVESVSQTQDDPEKNTYRLTTKKFKSGRLVAETTKLVRAR